MTTIPEPAAMDLPTPNLPLLRKVLDHIDAHPEQHRQAFWGYENAAPRTECGTAMCIAGWAMFFNGDDPSQPYSMRAAGRALGLTQDESWALFVDSIDLPESQRANIQAVAERIAARAGEIL